MINTVQSKSFQFLKPFFIVVCLILSQSAYSAEDAENHSEWEQKLINGNIAVSNFFDRIATGIDNFFVSKTATSRENKSNVAVENISNSSEGQVVSNESHFIANLRLPNVEDYFQLKFTTYDENEERGSKKKYGQQLTRQQNYGATVGLFRNLGDIRTAFQPRIELQDPLKVSHSLSFETSAKLTSYQFNPKLEFFANPDKGTGIFFAINYSFFLTNIYTLNWINEGEYEEKKKQFSTIIGLSLAQEITSRTTLAYSFFTNSNNKSNYHLEAYNLSVTWNHVLYQKILYYQIIPRLSFASEVSFKGAAGVAVVINLNF